MDCRCTARLSISLSAMELSADNDLSQDFCPTHEPATITKSIAFHFHYIRQDINIQATNCRTALAAADAAPHSMRKVRNCDEHNHIGGVT
jgi:hypothetical protein